MTNLKERVAVALWRHEAERAAPSAARMRTAQAFAEQDEKVRDRWLGFAAAAIAVMDTPSMQALGKCRKCGGDMVAGIATEQTFTAGSPDFPGSDVVTMSAGGPGVVVPCRKCIVCGWSVTA